MQNFRRYGRWEGKLIGTRVFLYQNPGRELYWNGWNSHMFLSRQKYRWRHPPISSGYSYYGVTQNNIHAQLTVPKTSTALERNAEHSLDTHRVHHTFVIKKCQHSMLVERAVHIRLLPSGVKKHLSRMQRILAILYASTSPKHNRSIIGATACRSHEGGKR